MAGKPQHDPVAAKIRKQLGENQYPDELSAQVVSAGGGAKLPKLDVESLMPLCKQTATMIQAFYTKAREISESEKSTIDQKLKAIEFIKEAAKMHNHVVQNAIILAKQLGVKATPEKPLINKLDDDLDGNGTGIENPIEAP